MEPAIALERLGESRTPINLAEPESDDGAGFEVNSDGSQLLL